jgi:hypothetical protein
MNYALPLWLITWYHVLGRDIQPGFGSSDEHVDYSCEWFRFQSDRQRMLP